MVELKSSPAGAESSKTPLDVTGRFVGSKRPCDGEYTVTDGSRQSSRSQSCDYLNHNMSRVRRVSIVVIGDPGSCKNTDCCGTLLDLILV